MLIYRYIFSEFIVIEHENLLNIVNNVRTVQFSYNSSTIYRLTASPLICFFPIQRICCLFREKERVTAWKCPPTFVNDHHDKGNERQYDWPFRDRIGPFGYSSCFASFLGPISRAINEHQHEMIITIKADQLGMRFMNVWWSTGQKAVRCVRFTTIRSRSWPICHSTHSLAPALIIGSRYFHHWSHFCRIGFTVWVYSEQRVVFNSFHAAPDKNTL